jgi:hypothetical protein
MTGLKYGVVCHTGFFGIAPDRPIADPLEVLSFVASTLPMSAADRDAQVAVMRQTARDAGRDQDALEHTRWGSITMSPEEAAGLAAEGVTRVVVSPATADLAGSGKSSAPSPSGTGWAEGSGWPEGPGRQAGGRRPSVMMAKIRSRRAGSMGPGAALRRLANKPLSKTIRSAAVMPGRTAPAAWARVRS